MNLGAFSAFVLHFVLQISVGCSESLFHIFSFFSMIVQILKAKHKGRCSLLDFSTAPYLTFVTKCNNSYKLSSDT